MNLIHTDLKPENILLVENGAYTLGPRVSSAAVMDGSERIRLKTIVAAILGKGGQAKAHPEKRRYPIDRLWERDFRQRVPLVGRQHTPLSCTRDHSR